MQSDWELSQDDVVRILDRIDTGLACVRLVSIAANWGPPISGRFSSDYLNIWAYALGKSDPPPTVTLYGYDDQRNEWRDIAEFERVRDIEMSGRPAAIYHVSIAPVPQFVLRMQVDGAFYYDNNDGNDYRIARYAGLQVTHLRRTSDAADHASTVICLPGSFLLRGSNEVATVSLPPVTPFLPL